MIDPRERCFEIWREAQLPSEPTLRQELAYRDGFADALRLLREHPSAVRAGDVHQCARPGASRTPVYRGADRRQARYADTAMCTQQEFD